MNRDYTICTLVYCFNRAGEALLLRRNRPPNRGLMSPCGGKLEIPLAESPHQCAAREVKEELGIEADAGDFRMVGMVSGQGEGPHYLMFLFEYLPRLERLPPPIEEGEFSFVAPESIADLDLPRTDRERLWPLFWSHRKGLFVARCLQGPRGEHWTLEESINP